VRITNRAYIDKLASYKLAAFA